MIEPTHKSLLEEEVIKVQIFPSSKGLRIIGKTITNKSISIFIPTRDLRAVVDLCEDVQWDERFNNLRKHLEDLHNELVEFLKGKIQ